MNVIVIGGKKMEINKIRLGGFRNIKDCEIDIDKLTGILSINSYGKSNVLKGIEFGIDFIISPNTVKNNMLGLKSAFPKNKNSLEKNFFFELGMFCTHDDKIYEVEYSYSFNWRISEDSNAKITDEILRIREKSKNKIFSHYIKRDGNKAFFKSTETGRCSKKILIDDEELVINKLLAFDDLFYNNIVKDINSFEIYIDRHLDSSDAFEFDPFVVKNADDLKLATVANIPRTLSKLKEHFPDKYDYLIDIYKQLFPKIEDITIKEFEIGGVPKKEELPKDFDFEIVDKVYMLFCKEYNIINGINFREMSDGAKRILLLLTNLLLAEINNVPLFCVEEPENSINPSLLNKYIEVIHDMSENTKILLTSHSPYLIEYLNPESLYIGCINEYDLTDFKKIKKSALNKLYKDAADNDMNYGDYLFDLFSSENNCNEIEKYVK